MRVLGRCVAAFLIVCLPGQAVTGGGRANDSKRASTCVNCYVLFALDRYFEIPPRYVIRRSAGDGCLTLTAPLPSFVSNLDPKQHADRLRTEFGVIRVCDRTFLDREVARIESENKPGAARVDGAVEIKVWHSDATKQRLTVTYFALNAEAMLVSDVAPDFAENIWREANREKASRQHDQAK